MYLIIITILILHIFAEASDVIQTCMYCDLGAPCGTHPATTTYLPSCRPLLISLRK